LQFHDDFRSSDVHPCLHLNPSPKSKTEQSVPFLIESVTFVFTPRAYFFSSRRLGDWLYDFPVLAAGYGCAFPWTGAFVFSFLGLVPWILLLIE